jgi:hypothetical protein
MRLLLLLYCLLTLACTWGEFAGVQCAGTTADAPTRVPAGTAIGKLKAGTVIMQNDTGNVANATNNTKTGQKGGAAATAPGAVASTTTQSGLSYWWLLAPVAGLLWWQRKRFAQLLL